MLFVQYILTVLIINHTEWYNTVPQSQSLIAILQPLEQN